MMQKRSVWIAQTGIFLALLLVAQIATRPFGNSILTGSLVNMILILTVMLCGLSSAMILGVISPFFSMMLGAAAFWPFIPVIIAGNLVIVTLWYLIALRREERSRPREIVALVVAAAVKFCVLYIGIVLLIVPLVLHIQEPQASVISAAFSWPQLITASVGGVLAILLFPVLSKAIKR